jgi:hypothetical protein
MTGPRFPAGRRIELHLHLLDRQIVDPDGRLLCKVDDLDLAQDVHGRPYVAGLLIGPAALGPRLGGRLGTWWVAIATRLSDDLRPRPYRIDISDVIDYGSAITVTRSAATRIATLASPLEVWLDEHLITRLPGHRNTGG